MDFFYSTDITDNFIVLSTEESHHCLKVLRKKVGDPVFVVDGKGTGYECIIYGEMDKKCLLQINNTINQFSARPYYLHMAVPLLKNAERTEWMIEKATEIGVDEISFIQTEHTERKNLNFDRIQKIAIAAMKQSQKAQLPIINGIVKFSDLITNIKEQQKYIAHCYTHISERELLLNLYTPNQTVLCAVGPEGDFSENEVKLALDNRFVPVTLGDSRLRSETAAMAICYTIAIANKIKS
jgi:16S rRNA (uracil1498-N3)-methyltransferase